jgi:predicted dehydrogenase
MSKPLRVGIIGANARGGWAGESHVPAVQALPGLVLAAVATNRQETADEAAHAFGAPQAFASGAMLIADPTIDIVTVATRVPDHHALVMAALAAGKHVYSEWPLGPGSVESNELAQAAEAAGTHHAIGLQLRGSPAVRTASALLDAGAIGRLLSVSTFSSTAGFGPEVAAPFVYLEDPAAFANLVTIQGAHTFDLVTMLGGVPQRLTALASRQFPHIIMRDDHLRQRRKTFDHLLMQGRLATDVPFTVEVAGGRKGQTPFWLELVGENGVLRLEGGAPRGAQSSRIVLWRDGERVATDDAATASMPDAAVNVAGIYASLRDDIVAGTRTAPGFGHAARLTRMIDAVLRSSADERTIAAPEWAA